MKGEGSDHTEMSLHALEQLRVGQIPAEEPTCGETSIEQQLVWVEGEDGADCAGGPEVVGEVLAVQVPHLHRAFCAPCGQDCPTVRPRQSVQLEHRDGTTVDTAEGSDHLGLLHRKAAFVSCRHRLLLSQG